MSGSALAKDVGAVGSGDGARLQATAITQAPNTAAAKAPSRARFQILLQPLFISAFQRDSTPPASGLNIYIHRPSDHPEIGLMVINFAGRY